MEEQVNDSHSDHHQSEKVIARLSRIEGHVGGIKKMVTEQKPCDQILIQIAAVRAALNRDACRSGCIGNRTEARTRWPCIRRLIWNGASSNRRRYQGRKGRADAHSYSSWPSESHTSAMSRALSAARDPSMYHTSISPISTSSADSSNPTFTGPRWRRAY